MIFGPISKMTVKQVRWVCFFDNCLIIVSLVSLEIILAKAIVLQRLSPLTKV